MWRNTDIFPGEWIGTEYELEFEKELNIGDKAMVIIDSQFRDYQVRRKGNIGTVIDIDEGDAWAYKLQFDDGDNWFKRCHLEKC